MVISVFGVIGVTCDYPNSMNKGKHCEGNFNETKSCNITRCPSKFCINFFNVLRTGYKNCQKI